MYFLLTKETKEEDFNNTNEYTYFWLFLMLLPFINFLFAFLFLFFHHSRIFVFLGIFLICNFFVLFRILSLLFNAPHFVKLLFRNHHLLGSMKKLVSEHQIQELGDLLAVLEYRAPG